MLEKYDLYRLLDLLKIKDKHCDIQIKSNITQAQKSCAIEKVIHKDNQYQIIVNLLSLAGLYGPLSHEHSAIFFDQKSKKKTELLDFSDIFINRLIYLLYENYRRGFIHIGSIDPEDNFVGRSLSALTGFSYLSPCFPKLKKRGIFPLFDFFWRRKKTIYGLLYVIKNYFNCHIIIKQFKGTWIKAERFDCMRLGHQYSTLGKDSVLGDKAWDTTHGVEITLGPMDWEQYLSFIPPMKKNFDELKELVHYYIGNLTTVYIKFHLRDDSNIKQPTLNHGTYLNYTTWLSYKHKPKFIEFKVIVPHNQNTKIC